MHKPDAVAPGPGYWETIAQGSDEEQAMAEAVGGTEVGRQLQALLALQPQEAVRYCLKHGDVTVTGAAPGL